MNLNLDKSAWKRVALGDVAKHVTDRVDAETSGLERFLAGEHIPSNDLAITQWGIIGRDPIGPMFYKRFKPGHVLYVSRRSYLRKTAVPEFEGITGEKTFVLESCDESVLLQRFLPFVLSAEVFHSYAVANSRGSVNPYINWTELANYEFDLPPLDEQQRLADLLWAVERYRLATTQGRDAASLLRSALVRERLSDGSMTEVPLGTLIRPGTSITYGIVQAGPEVEDGVPYIRVSDMTDGVLSVCGMKRTSPGIAERFERSRVESGDLVVALRGRTGLTLRVPSELDGANLTQGTARVAVDDAQVDPDYVLTIMNSDWMSRKINKQAKGSTFTELTLAALRSLPIPRLGRTEEAALLAELTAFDGATCASSEDLDSLGELRRLLLNNVFGDAE